MANLGLTPGCVVDLETPGLSLLDFRLEGTVEDGAGRICAAFAVTLVFAVDAKARACVSLAAALLMRFDFERPRKAHFFDLDRVRPVDLAISLLPVAVTVVMVRGIVLSVLVSGPYGFEGLPNATPMA